VHHSTAFNRREHRYPDYERALAWEEANLTQLIRSARSGRPIQEPRKARAKAVTEAPRKDERWCQGWLF
jgi:hypothetical protein